MKTEATANDDECISLNAISDRHNGAGHRVLSHHDSMLVHDMYESYSASGGNDL